MPYFRLVLLIKLLSSLSNPSVANTDQSSQLFDIWEFRIQGNSVLANKDIETSVYSYLGPDKTFEHIQQAQQSLSAIYRARGYAFASVTIPEQSVDQGIVVLKVVEGELGRVRVRGNQYFSRQEVLRQLPSLTPGEVPRIDDIKRELALLNRQTADRLVIPVAKSGARSETVDIDLKVSDELPLKAGFDYNNQYSPDTSDTRLGFNFSYDNLFQKQHTLGLFYLTTPQDRDEVEVLSTRYSMPLPWGESRLSLYYIQSESDVATIGDINVLGDGDIKGISAAFPVYFAKQMHEISLGLEAKDFQQTTFLAEGLTDDKPIDYVSLLFGYDGMLRTDATRYNFGVDLKSGLRTLGNREEEFEQKRAGAKNNFAIFYANVGVTHDFVSGYRFKTDLDMQLSGDPVIGNEQYSAGGLNSVRGYLSSQELADGGYTLQTELWTPELAELLENDLITSLRFLGFVDYARLHNRKAAVSGRASGIDIMGAGIGVRAGLGRGLSLDLDIASPLKRSSPGNAAVKSGDWLTHFSITGQY